MVELFEKVLQVNGRNKKKEKEITWSRVETLPTDWNTYLTFVAWK